jgi:cobalamin biosynthesis protein CobD/CbiB
LSLLVDVLRPDAAALAAALVADLIAGDPIYAAHPIRLIGTSLRWFESRLRASRFDGYGGGIALFVLLATSWLSALIGLTTLAAAASPRVGWVVHAALLYTMLVPRRSPASCRAD